MSRTDKDAPWWVTAERYVPDHRYCQEAGQHTARRWQYSPRGDRVCDLPAEPIYGNPRIRARWRGLGGEQHCTWEAEWPWRLRYRYTWGPTREDRHLGWWGPDRRLVRDECRKAAQEFRGTGVVEIAVSTRHHTHSPAKGWWD